jgi:hypothetical protein
MPRVMDRQTAEHFTAWLENWVHESEQHAVEQAVHALLRDDPSLVLTHSWPEMRTMTGV